MVGQGSVNHNSRAFNAKNTDPERSHLNITYCHENIKTVFHELFDEALKRYNDKQTSLALRRFPAPPDCRAVQMGPSLCRKKNELTERPHWKSADGISRISGCI